MTGGGMLIMSLQDGVTENKLSPLSPVKDIKQ